MKTTDKFLIGIVFSIVLLVGIAFAVAFLRPKPAYKPEGTPEAASHNYLLALRQGDYNRAYGYLSPTIQSYPASAETFAKNIRDNSWNFRLDEQAVSLEVVIFRFSRDPAERRMALAVLERRAYQFDFGLQGEQAELEQLIALARERFMQVGSILAETFTPGWVKKKFASSGMMLQPDIFEKRVKPHLSQGKTAYVWVGTHNGLTVFAPNVP